MGRLHTSEPDRMRMTRTTTGMRSRCRLQSVGEVKNSRGVLDDIEPTGFYSPCPEVGPRSDREQLTLTHAADPWRTMTRISERVSLSTARTQALTPHASTRTPSNTDTEIKDRT